MPQQTSLATGKAAKANHGASASSTSADKHPKKPAATDKRKETDVKDAKKANAKHAADSSHALCSTGEPKAKSASLSSRKLTDATAPAQATAHNEQTPSCDQVNAVPAKTTKPADSARVADKAETPATEPQHTHNDAQAISGATDELSQPKSSAPQRPSVPKRIGPVKLYMQHNLHKVDLMLVTD